MLLLISGTVQPAVIRGYLRILSVKPPDAGDHIQHQITAGALQPTERICTNFIRRLSPLLGGRFQPLQGAWSGLDISFSFLTKSCSDSFPQSPLQTKSDILCKRPATMETPSALEVAEEWKPRDDPSDAIKSPSQHSVKKDEEYGDVLANLTEFEGAKAVDVALNLVKGLRTFQNLLDGDVSDQIKDLENTIA